MFLIKLFNTFHNIDRLGKSHLLQKPSKNDWKLCENVFQCGKFLRFFILPKSTKYYLQLTTIKNLTVAMTCQCPEPTNSNVGTYTIYDQKMEEQNALYFSQSRCIKIIPILCEKANKFCFL